MMIEGDKVPAPDPTRLTTDLVDRAILSFREIIETRLRGMDRATELLANDLARLTDQLRAELERALEAERRVVETRLAGMDEATKLLATNVDKVPYAILQEAGNLKSYIMSVIEQVRNVSDEKFRAVDAAFASNALALTAALAAQKEAAAKQNESNTLAITKSEQATKETIVANAAQTIAGLGAQAAAHQDLKERFVRLEASGLGHVEERTDQRANAGSNIALVMAVMVGLSIFISLASLMFTITR